VSDGVVYAGDDPVNKADPTGFLACPAVGGSLSLEGSTLDLVSFDSIEAQQGTEEIATTPPGIVAQHEMYIWGYFHGKGLTDVQAAAILGNLFQEDVNLDPTQGQIGGGGGYGLLQWGTQAGGSWGEVVKTAGSVARAQTFDFQVYFIWAELSQPPLLPWVANATQVPVFRADRHSSIDKATTDFDNALEGAGQADIFKRYCYAQSVYDSHGTAFIPACTYARSNNY